MESYEDLAHLELYDVYRYADGWYSWDSQHLGIEEALREAMDIMNSPHAPSAAIVIKAKDAPKATWNVKPSRIRKSLEFD